MFKTAIAAAGLALAQARGCPELGQFRSQNVLNFYEPAQVMGHWYENAYQDVAQTGASCQNYENSDDDLGFKQAFHAKYSLVPFSQTYIYEQLEGEDEKGMYVKYVEGNKDLLSLPTVVVDFTVDGEGNYTTMTEYTCTVKVGVATTELRFSSRDSALTDDLLEQLKKKAIEQGIPEHTVNNVSVVDHSKCKDSFDAYFLQ